MGFGNADVDAFEGSLVSVWKMDESSGTRFDAVGSNNLTDVNTVGSASGQDGLAADFVAANSETLTLAAGVTDTSGNFAISTWLNSDGSPTGQDFPLAQYNTGSGINAVVLAWGGGTVYKGFIQDTVFREVVSANITTGVFHHIVLIVDGSTFYLYRDGTLDDSVAFTGTLVVAQNFRIGCRDEGAGDQDFWDGLADETAFWNGPSWGGGNPTRQQFVDGLFNGGAGNFFADPVFRASAAQRFVSPVDKYPAAWQVW